MQSHFVNMEFDRDDIVEVNHCIDNEDELMDRNYSMMTTEQRKVKDDYSNMQATAIDTYFKILQETGNKQKANEAFSKIHSDFYARN